MPARRGRAFQTPRKNERIRCEGKKAPELSWGPGLQDPVLHSRPESYVGPSLGRKLGIPPPFPMHLAPSHVCGRAGGPAGKPLSLGYCR